MYTNKIYREKSIPMTALWCLAFMPETQQPIIVIILIIYSPYLLKDLVEYISDRIATCSY